MSETLSMLILKSAEIHEASFTGDVQQKDLIESISQAAASMGVDANSQLVEYVHLLLTHSWNQALEIAYSKPV